jgi:hypothetical protein
VFLFSSEGLQVGRIYASSALPAGLVVVGGSRWEQCWASDDHFKFREQARQQQQQQFSFVNGGCDHDRRPSQEVCGYELEAKVRESKASELMNKHKKKNTRARASQSSPASTELCGLTKMTEKGTLVSRDRHLDRSTKNKGH